VSALSTALLALALTGCGMQMQETVQEKPKPKEYFAESEYGVKASPRVATAATKLPRGGGRAHVGKPYQVRGQWYYPQEVANYSKTGKASWYGDAFHGRLTANGEIYDMTHLTAAHPTLPLPSYARVTNLDNGHSVIVRVNDRGPFSPGRIIDLSRRAAELLEYTRRGVANVQVEYIGPAPLHGQDDEFLLASYRPAGKGRDGLPADVMLAMNRSGGQGVTVAGMELPELAPIPQQRPQVAEAGRGDRLVLSYAAESRPAGKAGEALEKLVAGRLQPQDVIRSWMRRHGDSLRRSSVFIGNFDSSDEARRLLSQLSQYGRAEIRHIPTQDGTVHELIVHPAVQDETALIRHAWSLGATDAFRIVD